MNTKTLNAYISLPQLLEEADTIAQWEAVQPETVAFHHMVVENRKVIRAEGTIVINGRSRYCVWNYQKICLDKRTLTVIEEGCL